MKLTNKLSLPQALVDAVSTRAPGKSYSASMLNQSPRMVWLQRRHFDEIEEDVSDRIWAIFGTAVHAIIEKSNPENTLQEEYLSHDFPEGRITGRPDIYQDGVISDWKTVSVWSYIFMDDDKRHEYEVQLNTYALLFRKAGFEVKELEIVMLMRDWQASKAKYDPAYPQCQVYRLPIRLWPDDEAETFIRGKMAKFEEHRDTPDTDLPLCTDKERWSKPSKWALMKTGRKSAIKLYEEKQDFELEPGQYWEERPGEQWKRCEYCSASAFCNQFQGRIQ